MIVLKKLELGVGLGLLAAVLTFGPGPVSAQTPVPPPARAVVVGESGPYCPSPSYSTIQSAIDAVSAGATIYVCEGTYNESLTINKPINLDGAQYDVNAGTRDGSAETVINGSAGITYTTGATSGSINGFTLTGYEGSVAAIDADGVGSGWQFLNDFIDVSDGGIFLNTAAVADPAPSSISGDVFLQQAPSAATSGDEGIAIIIGDGTGNNISIVDNSFQNLSGPGAAISTPGTAACGAALDSTNFSESLVVAHNAMSEDGGAFTDPVNGPGFIDEPFLSLECTNEAQIRYNTVSDTEANDPSAKTAVILAGGDWATELLSNTLSGSGALNASGVDVNSGTYPSGTGTSLVDNIVSGYGKGILIQGGSSFSVSKNVVDSSSVDGIDIETGSGGTLLDNAVSGSGSYDCIDSTSGTGSDSTADVWTGNGGVTSSPTGLCATFEVPVFTSSTNAVTNVGAVTSISVTTTGYPVPKLRATHLPTGLTFVDNQNGTGTISGVLGDNSAGAHTIQLQASNVFRITPNFTEQRLSLQVDRAPAIMAIPPKPIVPGASFTLRVKAAGYPRPVLAESGALPPGLSFVDNGNGTASLSGTVASPITAITWPMTITATNSSGATSQQITLTTRTSQVRFDSALDASALMGEPFSYTISTSTDLPTPTLSETGALPSGITFVDNHNGTATLSGTVSNATPPEYRILLNATTIAGTTSRPFRLSIDTTPTFSSPTSLTVSTGRPFKVRPSARGNPVPTVSEVGTLPPGVTFTSGKGHGVLSGELSTSGVWSISLVASSAAGSATLSMTLISHTR